MTSVTCVMAWLCAVLMVPLMLFIWALDTKKTRIKRWMHPDFATVLEEQVQSNLSQANNSIAEITPALVLV